MFLFRSFYKSKQSTDDESQQRVVDMADPSLASGTSSTSATSGGGSGTKASDPVISVSDNDDIDGFSSVQVRPLTYAEVATIAGGVSSSKPRKVYMPVFDDDEGYHEEAACASQSAGDAADQGRRYGYNVLSEVEYGQKADDVLSKYATWGKIRHDKLGYRKSINNNNKTRKSDSNNNKNFMPLIQ